MNDYEYTPEEALSLLMKKLKERNEMLASKIQSAIDAGHYISKEEPNFDRKKKPRTYWKKVAYSHAEAIQIALNALESYFIEQPLFVESMIENMSKTALEVPNSLQVGFSISKDKRDGNKLESNGMRKPIEIELQTATQIYKTEMETAPVTPTSHDLIVEQQNNFRLLRDLIKFKEV